jgi:hypothetical protein
MADFLQTNTPRLRVTQTGARGSHKLTFRYPPAGVLADAIAAARSIVTLMLAFNLSGTSYESAEWAAEGSDVFLPATWGSPITGGAQPAATNAVPYGLYLNFLGRTSAGSRVAWYVFNTHPNSQSANNRLTPAESSDVTDLIAAFTTSATVLCGIDQNTFVMKAYANTGINDRIAKKSRSLV